MRFPQSRSNAPVLPRSYMEKENIREEESAFPFFFCLSSSLRQKRLSVDNKVFYSKEHFLTTTSELMYEKRRASSEVD